MKLLDGELITAEDIEKGVSIKGKVESMTYLAVTKKLGEETDEVLIGLGIKGVSTNRQKIQTIVDKKTKAIDEIVIDNMTIKDLADEKAVGEMKVKDIADRIIDFATRIETNEDIENAARGEAEEGVIRDFVLKKKAETVGEAAGEAVTRALKPTEDCAIIAIDFAQALTDRAGGFRLVTANDPFVEKKAAGNEDTETTIADVVKATGNRMAVVTDTRDLEAGMIMVLTSAEDKTHVITIKDVKKDDKGNVTEITYAANIKEKAGIIQATVKLEDLMEGVTLEENGNLVKGGDSKWEGAVLASRQAMKKAGVADVRQIQNIFGMKKAAAEGIGIRGMRTLAVMVKEMTTPTVRGVTGSKGQSPEIRALAGLLKELKLGQDSTPANISRESLSKLFGVSKSAGKEEIMNAVLSRMKMLGSQATGDNEGGVALSVELTAVAGGLLLAMENQGRDRVGALNQSRVNGNQGTITRLLRAQYKDNYSKAGQDFIIDIAKLQKAATEKTYSVEKREKILDALATDSSAWKEDEKMIVGLFKLQNVRAIAASA